MDNILSVGNSDLERLNPDQAVDFFRKLLWAEASTLGIAKSLIDVPSAITCGDGGIDAEVRDVQITVGQGIIRSGLTRYQIKTGNFKLDKTNIREILFYKSSGALKSRIKSCFDRQGTLIVVLFGSDKPEQEDNQIIKKFRKLLSEFDTDYAKAKIEIFRQNNIISFLEPFPSLALLANGRGSLRFQTHRSWSLETEMRRPFRLGWPQEDFMDKLRNGLREDEGPIHINIWGEAGVGKTRLVLEALKADDLEHLVVYCSAASKFTDSDLMNEILREDSNFSAITILDECDPNSRYYIWNKLMHKSPRIKLISIYNELNQASGETRYLNVPPLEKENIISIIESYEVPKGVADRYSEFCDGSPRAAHVFGQNLKRNPEDLLRPLDTVNQWERTIAGSDDPNSQEVNQRRTVLEHIALFKRFGHLGPHASEAETIAGWINQVDPQITRQNFQNIILKLKERKILQGEYTLYITPKVFHIYLWTEWWRKYGDGFDSEIFLRSIPSTLQEWFFEMFKYSAESEVASRIVIDLLDKNGPFGDGKQLNSKLGSQFFAALAEGNPYHALACLQRTIGTWNRDELMAFTTGRREVVHALEKIVIWRDLFADAARLLLALGEAENEAWSNNASGIFAELFSPGYGAVAPTEASPEERFPLLKETLESTSKEIRMLALRACDRALESRFSRSVGAEYQGLRRTPQLWMPKTWKELYDAYSRVWNLLLEKLDTFEGEEQSKALDILLQNSRSLAAVPNLTDMVIGTFEALMQKPDVDKKRLLEKIIQIIHYDGEKMTEDTRKRWIELKEGLTGKGFSSLMKRYVGMDIFEDKFDEDGKMADQAEPRIKELAKQACEKHDLLEPELLWIVKADTINAFRFGYELGLRNKSFSLLPNLLEAQRMHGERVNFLSGYLRSIFEFNTEMWEELLEAFAEEQEMVGYVPEITWRSGMTDRAAMRILKLAERGSMETAEFRIFSAGIAYRDISEDVFLKWLDFLLDSPDHSAALIALEMMDFYYRDEKRRHVLPEEVTLRLLMHNSFFEKGDSIRRDQMEEYHWAEIGKAFVELYPARSLELAHKMLEHFGEGGSILESPFSRTYAVINEITRRFPGEVWIRAAKYLAQPRDSRAFHIEQWLRGGEFAQAGEEGILPLIPSEKIWEWVDEDIENRAWYIASFVPNRLFRGEGKICLARETLAMYGERKDVRDNLFANFSTEGWSGPASIHYQNKRDELLEFKMDEDNEKVKNWIDEYVSKLEKRIENAKIEEERIF